MSEYVVTEPGVYDIPEDAYHRDPVPDGSLSASAAKKLLTDGGPARYRYQLEHPEPPSEAMELGTAAHKLVLGVGQELHEVKADSWSTKAAKQGGDDARQAGKVPLLTHQMATVRAMADALRSVPLAAALLNPERSRPEMSAFWIDPDWKLWRRCRFDLMPEPRPGQRHHVIGDYKTCKDASKRGFAKAIADYRYDIQSVWYRDGYEAIYGIRPEFLFIAQEKTPPYLTGVYRIDAEAEAIARESISDALEIWRDCREAEADERQHAWPGYSLEIETLALPRWSRAREDFYA